MLWPGYSLFSTIYISSVRGLFSEHEDIVLEINAAADHRRAARDKYTEQVCACVSMQDKPQLLLL